MQQKKTSRRVGRKPLYSLDKSPAHLLHRAQQRASDMTAQALRAYGLTPRQYAVLLALRGENAMTQSALVRMTGIDRSTLADMLARMGRRQLINSQRTEADQRANLVTITEQGQRAVEAVAPKVADAEHRMLDALPDEMRDVFVQALQLISDSVRR